MNTEVFITCAVTGSGETTAKSDKVPVTPQQIGQSAIDAARAGAAIAHIHVRDPHTGFDGFVAHEFIPKGDPRQALQRTFAECAQALDGVQPE